MLDRRGGRWRCEPPATAELRRACPSRRAGHRRTVGPPVADGVRTSIESTVVAIGVQGARVGSYSSHSCCVPAAPQRDRAGQHRRPRPATSRPVSIGQRRRVLASSSGIASHLLRLGLPGRRPCLRGAVARQRATASGANAVIVDPQPVAARSRTFDRGRPDVAPGRLDPRADGRAEHPSRRGWLPASGDRCSGPVRPWPAAPGTCAARIQTPVPTSWELFLRHPPPSDASALPERAHGRIRMELTNE